MLQMASQLNSSKRLGVWSMRILSKPSNLFFRSGKLLGEVNTTIFSLVPKVPNPFKIGGFQPNSCCNIVYTFITTILANRLKHCLNDLIGQILDNICPW